MTPDPAHSLLMQTRQCCFIDLIMVWDTIMKQSHMILGRDSLDAEVQRDRWLSDHPRIRVLRMHPPRAEPRTLLTRIGGRGVPRVSIEVEYED